MAIPKLNFKPTNNEVILNQSANSGDLKLAIWAVAAIVVIVLVVLMTSGSMTGQYTIRPLCPSGALAVEGANDAYNLQFYQGFSCTSSMIPSIKCCTPPVR